MGAISQIRNRSGLLITVIAVAMGLFVLGDLLGPGGGSFGGPETDVASINGKVISYSEFETRVQRESGGQSLNAERMEQLRERVWNLILQEEVLYSEFDKIGLDVSPEEVFYEIKNNNTNQILTRYFTNPQTGQIYDQLRDPQTGGLSNQLVINYIKQLMAQGQDQDWLPVETAIKSDRINKKYNNLIARGIYISAKEAEFVNNVNTAQVSFDYVAANYTSISNEELSYDDSDLKSYYNSNKTNKDYSQDETTRGIEYVIFNVLPTDNDKQLLLNDLNDIVEEFKSSENDTLFVNQNADTPLNIKYYTQGTIPQEYDSAVFSENSNGTVFGPYTEGNSYKLSKVLKLKATPDSTQARHILIPITEKRSEESINNTMDSVKTELANGVAFGDIAKALSIDKVSADNDGDLGWFIEGQMVPEFNDACFNASLGEILTVKTQYGIHLIEITDQSKLLNRALLAVVDRQITPSNNTFDDVFNEASAFSINNSTTETFRAQGQQYGIEPAPFLKENDKVLGQLENPRTLIRWAFENEIGAVSEPYEMGTQFVVATLTSIKEEGILPFEEVKDLVETEFLKEKKAEVIIGKISGSDLDAIAGAVGASVQTASNVEFSAFSIPGIGPEGELLGKVFSMEPNSVSEPIKGDRGVYVVKVTEVIPADANANITSLQASQLRNVTGRANFEVFEGLKKVMNINDNRSKFY